MPDAHIGVAVGDPLLRLGRGDTRLAVVVCARADAVAEQLAQLGDGEITLRVAGAVVAETKAVGLHLERDGVDDASTGGGFHIGRGIAGRERVGRGRARRVAAAVGRGRGGRRLGDGCGRRNGGRLIAVGRAAAGGQQRQGQQAQQWNSRQQSHRQLHQEGDGPITAIGPSPCYFRVSILL